MTKHDRGNYCSTQRNRTAPPPCVRGPTAGVLPSMTFAAPPAASPSGTPMGQSRSPFISRGGVQSRPSFLAPQSSSFAEVVSREKGCTSSEVPPPDHPFRFGLRWVPATPPPLPLLSLPYSGCSGGSRRSGDTAALKKLKEVASRPMRRTA